MVASRGVSGEGRELERGSVAGGVQSLSTAPRTLYTSTCWLHRHSSTSQTDLSTMKVLEAGRVDQGAGKGSDEGEEEEKIEAGSLGSMIKREREQGRGGSPRGRRRAGRQGCHRTKKEPGEAKKEPWALAARSRGRPAGPSWCSGAGWYRGR